VLEAPVCSVLDFGIEHGTKKDELNITELIQVSSRTTKTECD
jgi:hypothetical protein